MNQIKVKGLENKDYKVVQAQPRYTPPDFFVKKHFLGAIIGQRGSGKTNAMLSLVFHCDKFKFFDKVYLFSPTSYNDPKYTLLETNATYYTIKKYHTYTDEYFGEVVDEIKSDIDEFKEWEKAHKLFKKFMKKGSSKMSTEELTVISRMMIDEETIEEPHCRFKQMPTSLILLDDLVGNTELYKSSPKGVFYNFAILHRHLLTSILFITQTWSQAVPKQIRANLSLLLLFDLKPEIKKVVADEMASNMREDEFIKLWETACVQPYDFFLMNFDFPKKLRFRQNFDTIFSI